MTVAKTLCHIHEAGACHEGCVYAYSLDDEVHVQARAYYSLCDRARAVGVPTDCEDPASPTTVAGLEAAVIAAESAPCPCGATRHRLEGGAMTTTTYTLEDAKAAIVAGGANLVNPERFAEKLVRQASPDWKPGDWERWRHGGWYVGNLHYPNGAVGCVSNNYADKKWRIACDPRPFDEQPTFRNRSGAAIAERDLITEQIARTR